VCVGRGSAARRGRADEGTPQKFEKSLGERRGRGQLASFNSLLKKNQRGVLRRSAKKGRGQNEEKTGRRRKEGAVGDERRGTFFGDQRKYCGEPNEKKV